MHSRVIGRTRKVRKGYAMFISFKDENVPQKPKADSLKMLHIKFLNKGPFDVIKQVCIYIYIIIIMYVLVIKKYIYTKEE